MTAREDIVAHYGSGLSPTLELLLDVYRTEVLADAADELVAYCPDHGSKATAFITCQCLGADDLRRMETRS